MVTPNDFRTGMIVIFENKLYKVVEFQHVKPGKGGAFVRARLKDVREGFVLDRTFRHHETMEEVHVEEKPSQFLYKEGSNFLFMDKETYDQVSFSEKQVGDQKKFLKEGMEVLVVYYTEKTDRAGTLVPLSIEMPNFVELKVDESPPGVKGDTVALALKEVTLENGYRISVPLFIKEGDVLKINTANGEYVERV